MMRAPSNRLRSMLRKARNDDAGSAGVEFALIAPVFMLLLAATFEIGLAMRAQFGLISAVSAAANHTLSIGDAIDDGSAPNVAAALAALVADGSRSATINLNNAVTAHMEQGIIETLNTGADVTACYCASRPADGFTWGEVTECGIPCTDGSVAGRFVEISADVPFNSIIGLYGSFVDQSLQNSAVVRLP